jgi:hypothetical protein
MIRFPIHGYRILLDPISFCRINVQIYPTIISLITLANRKTNGILIKTIPTSELLLRMEKKGLHATSLA